MPTNVRELFLKYKPRLWQLKVHRLRKKFCMVSSHRRSGKDELGLADMGNALLSAAEMRGLFCAPLKQAGFSILWDRALKFYEPVIRSAHVSTGIITLLNRSTLQIAGEGEKGQALRGQSWHAVILDEYAQFSDETFHAVIRPALSDTNGECLFLSTPSGGKDAFYRLWKSTQGLADWSHFKFKASETGILSPEEIASARATMPKWTFDAEYECDELAPAPGAIFGEAMAAARDEGRLLPSIPIEPDLELQAAIDLGISDACSVFLFQAMASEVRILAYKEFNGVGLREVALALKEQGVTAVTVPHDIRVRELVSGRSRLELLQDLGLEARIAASVSVEEGLSSAERLLSRCHFDLKHADLGIDRLRGYRRNPETGKPIHDDCSHGADAFRYLALALEPSGPVRRSPSGAVTPIRPVGSRSIIAGSRR